ncbi:unnamed protein product [Adineta steineri]|uniref:EGF-like domain-containing protein n=1 Tax=Adineta steineri TaxID=433720 RepID=A0A818M4F3_9BILA|nr:unnamed protein product [Adineta steineri]CAF3580203.1 unnamed protein product [Adineta steineri]
MLANVLIVLYLFQHHTIASNILSQQEYGIRFKQAITDAIKKIDNIAMSCPLGSFFYNGSCYFYLPPKQIINMKGIRFDDVSASEAASHCRLLHSQLWDIETIDEFAFVLDQIYTQTQSFDSPRIAINFTQGRNLLKLRKKSSGEQYVFISNTNEYSLIYKPLYDLPSKDLSLIIDISKATKRIYLEEKFRLERRSDHYICKMKINSCYNNTHCGQHGQCQNLVVKYKCICNFMYTGEHCQTLSSRGIQSIIGIIFICLASLLFIYLSISHLLCRRKTKIKTSMKTSNSPCLSREDFYSIPNLSSDQLLKQNDLTISSPHIIVDLRRSSIQSSSSSSTVIFFRHNYFFYLWRLLIGLTTILFATFCCYTIYEFKIENLKTKNLTTDQITTSKICKLFQINFNLYYKVPVNYISLIILFLLIIILILFENITKQKFKSFCYHFTIPMIFNSHSHIYRFESAAVFGIISLEILHIFDEFIINGTKHFQNGPLIDLILQFGIGLMLGLRYFPILTIFEQENNYENRLANIICYALATIYLYCEIIFKLQSDINCQIDKNKVSMIKEIYEKFNKMGVDIKQYLMLQLDTNQTHQLNETYQNTQLWFNEQIEKHLSNSTYDDKNEIENDITRLNYSLELNKQSIFYNTLRYAPYYYFISFLAIRLTLMFLNTFRNTINKNSDSYQSSPRWKYVKYNLLKTPEIYCKINSNEYSRLFRFFNSIIIFFKQNIYSIRPYFRYSKLIICIYTSAITLIYYFTFWIQDHTYILTKKLLLFLNLILCALADLSKDLCYNLNFNHINRDIKYICLLTAFITCVQLFLGLKHYQIQMCNAYRGIFNDIPTAKHISAITIVSKSMHYPGRFMGSLVYSYGFLFLFVSIIYILSRYVLYSIIILEFVAKLFLPMIVFLLFQLLFVRLLCKLLFVEKTHFLALRNLRLYYTFSYFSFFFDCFLGFLMCLTRITKAFVCSVVFFARLDYSPYGRGLEMYDSSYASYVSYFHIEKNQRHPVLNVFIDIIRQRLIEIRKLKYKLSVGTICQTYEQDRLSQKQRFRWALAYTLIKNEQLKRYRKHRLDSNKTIQSKTLGKIFDKIGLTQTLTRKY